MKFRVGSGTKKGLRLVVLSGTLLFFVSCLVGCGLSSELKTHLAGLYTKAATAECNCKKLTEEDNGYSACIDEYEERVHILEMFNKIHETSDAVKQEASMEADDIRAQCI